MARLQALVYQTPNKIKADPKEIRFPEQKSEDRNMGYLENDAVM